METIGNLARVEILHALSAQGPLTTPQIYGELGAARTNTLRHLEALEALGLVVADEPPNRRHGRLVTWAVNRAAVKATGEALIGYMLGES
ncbi:ArsR/SmtB family transcription factor [Luteimicrobium sp. DT211]|uniref:ArsR/SmtB family transcription factor n=1 Tax=Luteimicrobium sp. DT211 TaxID=3393412 RepID=UPI003CF2DECA